MREAIATGATVEEAKEAATALLDAKITSNVEFEILELPQKKTLGLFGGSLAKVRAYTEDEGEPVAAPVPKSKDKPAPKDEGDPIAAPTPKRSNKQPAPKKVKPAVETPAEIKAAVARADEYLRSILNRMDLGGCTIEQTPAEEGCELQINGGDPGFIIGHRGETLDALQHLVNLAANRGEEKTCRITLNTGNYREKREQTLEGLARRMAETALRTGRNQALEPMNPYERRLIHTTVQDMEGVSSWSIGEGYARRVIIGTAKGEGSAFRTRDDIEHDRRREPRGARQDGGSHRSDTNHHSGGKSPHGEKSPHGDWGKSGDRSRGGRGPSGGNASRGSGRDRRERPAPYVPQNEPREARKDADALPLYGKIEKPE